MKIFDIIFKNDLEGAEKLFVKGGTYDGEKNCLAIEKQTADFETYFNLLPAWEYALYCGIEKVRLDLQAKGSYLLELNERLKNGACRRLASYECDGNCSVPLDISGILRGGYVFFTVTSHGRCEIYGGAWRAEKEAERNVKIGVVICTYRREEYVAANLERVAAAMELEPEFTERLHFFVIDNAKTLKLADGDFYTVIQNRNLGGSGGFTRGICEVCADRSFTHFLLMDDDIYFDFCTLKRTYALLSMLKEEYANATIGGAMMYMDRPCVQHAFGEKYNGLRAISFNSRLDMTLPENLIKNECIPEPDYFGWWYCCMPVNTVEKYGLPFPFFIKFDDIEYCLRAMETPIITSGLAVWHQDFTLKYSPTLEYYKRNEAVNAVLHQNAGALKMAVRFAYFAFKALTMKNYEASELLLRGYDDFFRGPQFFLEADSVRINEQVREHLPQWLTPEEIAVQCGIAPSAEDIPEHPNTGKLFNLLRTAISAENFLPAFFFSKKPAVTSATNPCATDCFLKRTVIYFDKQTQKGYICRLDVKKRRLLRRKSIKYFFRIIFSYRKMCRIYSEGAKKMCSRLNWDRLFFGTGEH